MRLKELREMVKVTQEQIAQKLDVDQTAVSKWETGDSLPRADKLPELARILNCTIDELLAEESEAPQ